jgi:hypothetical protein
MAFCGTHIYERVRTQLACVPVCAMHEARALSSTLTALPNPASLPAPSLRWRCPVACVNNQGLRLLQTPAAPSPTSLLRSSTSRCSPRPPLWELPTASPRRPLCRSLLMSRLSHTHQGQHGKWTTQWTTLCCPLPVLPFLAGADRMGMMSLSSLAASTLICGSLPRSLPPLFCSGGGAKWQVPMPMAHRLEIKRLRYHHCAFI